MSLIEESGFMVPATGGGGITDPNDLTSLYAWFNPDDATHLFQDTAGTIAVGIGDTVARINSQNDAGIFLTQSTSIVPQLLADGLTFSADALKAPAQTDEAGTAGDDLYVMSVGKATGAGNSSMISHAYNANGWVLGTLGNPTTGRMTIDDGTTTATNITNTMPTIQNVRAMLEMHFVNSTNTGVFYRDEVAGTNELTFTGDVGYHADDRLSIGGQSRASGSTNYWAGVINDQVVLVNPSAQDITDLRAWANAKWTDIGS